MDKPNESDVKSFSGILESAALIQLVNEPTHKHNHILYLIITSEGNNCVGDVVVYPLSSLPSDHAVTQFDVVLHRVPVTRRTIKFHKTCDIDHQKFQNDILNSNLVKQPAVDLNDQTHQYDLVLKELLNKHAPENTRQISLRPHAPWYDNSLRILKQKKRSLERKFKKSGLSIDKEVLNDKCTEYKKALMDAKRKCHRQEIVNSDQKRLFNVVEKLTVHRPSQLLPSHSSKKELAEDFSFFFHEKIRKLRLALDVSVKHDLSVHVHENCTTQFTEFQPLDLNDMLKIIKGSKIKSCPLDPLPAFLTSQYLEALLPSITQITNKSLQHGVFPSSLKSALVLPLLKKSSLDPDIKKNYRPISNLAFLGKVIERSAMQQFASYLSNNNLFAQSQSAYRQYHSTETVLVRVFNDILIGLDNKEEAFLVLLDLTAAFDTINHTVLLNRLKTRYGIGGNVLKWFASYLEERQQIVTIGEERSNPVNIEWGIPQGSVAGPIIFVVYTAPVEDIIHAHGLSCITYADDTQYYFKIKL